jgi:hypothetical protein
LVHHVRTHAENDTVQVASLGGIAEDLTPRGRLFIFLGLYHIYDLLKLAQHLLVVSGLIK